jgi:hypothetical protein
MVVSKPVPMGKITVHDHRLSVILHPARAAYENRVIQRDLSKCLTGSKERGKVDIERHEYPAGY